jgi:hypothetical protein
MDVMDELDEPMGLKRVQRKERWRRPAVSSGLMSESVGLLALVLLLLLTLQVEVRVPHKIQVLEQRSNLARLLACFIIQRHRMSRSSLMSSLPSEGDRVVTVLCVVCAQ